MLTTGLFINLRPYSTITKASTASVRHAGIDIMRATAVILMVIFHLAYDLNFFNVAAIDIPNGDGWREFRVLIVTLFLLSMGISLKLAYPSQLHWSKFIKRITKLGVSAVLISFASLLIVPENWIFFGIIHFIFFASLCCIAFRNSPNIALIIGGIILLVDYMQLVPRRWPFNYIEAYLPQYTNDYTAIFPWLAIPFIGIWLAHQKLFVNYPFKNIKCPKYAEFISKNALIIYLLHQPIFFAIFYLFK
ncbi:hypothetical protein tinsulaeT_10730 [Thalassotalea insulae]|uniref:Heparan-alpha-glucosaminide N-acetyltransferase catalytic domain-containing protein n=1 Tax=Thalassotalea insulae TaxID=2056778 RepID=A0ABQ6GP33_9GAMM|nr:heparan-alpha-glucosaminide N-acetyltransferase domain-containing protein [Thalassotalea insulae]GLX77733.1 hypothetical protein tinsulaeT_10730 [Thalassotalea insulae]